MESKPVICITITMSTNNRGKLQFQLISPSLFTGYLYYCITELYLHLLPSNYSVITMASKEELENQCVPISKLQKFATEWVIKVILIRRGLIKEYKNSNGEGVRWLLIFVDEEVTLI